eukprot:1303450-Amphidinium_carterae.1
MIHRKLGTHLWCTSKLTSIEEMRRHGYLPTDIALAAAARETLATSSVWHQMSFCLRVYTLLKKTIMLDFSSSNWPTENDLL